MSILKVWNVDLEKVFSDAILDERVLQFLLLMLEQQTEMQESNVIIKAA
jgi:hypothetical protein